MNLRDLLYVSLLAEHKSFRKAAEAAHVSQPTLSSQIAKLEAELGLQLFERSSRQVALTSAGEAILNEARKINEHVTTIKSIAASYRNPLAGTFRLGIIASLSPYLAPDLLADIRRHAPSLDIILREGLTDELIAALKSHSLDAIVIATETHERGFAARSLFDEDFLLALPHDHPLARKAVVTAADIKESDLLLLDEGHCLRDQALEVCMTDKVDARVKATSLTTLVRLVERGEGVTLLPKLAARFFPQVTLRPLPGLAASRTIRLVSRTAYGRGAALDLIAASCNTVAAAAQIA